MARYHLEPQYVILCLKSKMFSLKNNKLFQACIPLALVLTFFCTPVFSLVSYVDTDKYTSEMSSVYNGLVDRYGVDSCFDGNMSSQCASGFDASITITFPQLTNVSDFQIMSMLGTPYDLYSHFDVNGVDVYVCNDVDGCSYDLVDVNSINIYSTNSSILFIREVDFNFETVDVGNGVSDNDITQGINWHLFAYSFTVVTFFAMLGRGVKSVIDLIKYG